MFKKRIATIIIGTFVVIGTLVCNQNTAKADTMNGWEQSGSTWNYYVNGNKTTGWFLVNGKWYYFNSNGDMATGWTSYNGVWYYLRSSGDMATGWFSYNDKWYYFKDDGKMATSWNEVNGKWYFFKSNGDMATGWISDGNKWYYLNKNGDMATGWITVNGKSYYLTSNGDMLVNTTTPDGYVVGSDGAWNGQARATIDKITDGQETIWEAENNDQLSTANKLSKSNTYVYGNISNANDIDYYKFTITSNKRVTVAASFLEDPSLNGNLLVCLVDQNDKGIVAGVDFTVDNLVTKCLSISLAPGTYYFAVYQNDKYNYSWHNDNYIAYLQFT